MYSILYLFSKIFRNNKYFLYSLSYWILSKSHIFFHLLKYSRNKSFFVFLSKLLTTDFTNKFLAIFSPVFNLSKLFLKVLNFQIWKYLFNKSLSDNKLFFAYILNNNFDFNCFNIFLLIMSFHLLKAFLNKSLSFFSRILYNLRSLLLNLSGLRYLSNLSKNSSPKFLINKLFILLIKSSMSLGFLDDSINLIIG